CPIPDLTSFPTRRSSDLTGSCSVTLTSATTVTATFDLQPFTLTVSKAGTSDGTVTSTPAGITCGANCAGSYASGTAVTLTATPEIGRASCREREWIAGAA